MQNVTHSPPPVSNPGQVRFKTAREFLMVKTIIFFHFFGNSNLNGFFSVG